MNNLHRELAPISDAAWSQIEAEATKLYSLLRANKQPAELRIVDGEIEEEIVDQFDHFVDPGIAAIDLVDDDNRSQADRQP